MPFIIIMLLVGLLPNPVNLSNASTWFACYMRPRHLYFLWALTLNNHPHPHCLPVVSLQQPKLKMVCYYCSSKHFTYHIDSF